MRSQQWFSYNGIIWQRLFVFAAPTCTSFLANCWCTHSLAPAANPPPTCCVPPARKLMGTRTYGPASCATVSESFRVCVCVCLLNMLNQTGAETLHLRPRHYLHRPFPACRVIPAPVLPPLPSHTYQPPAAVPLPETGSSSLDTADKQQPLIHPCLSLSLFLCFLELSGAATLPGSF